MNNIVAVIGCGNLGRRHLQAIANSKISLDIYVYDINKEVFDIARDILRQSEVNKQTNVYFIDNLEMLPLQVDVCVVASSSKERKVLIEKVLGISTVNYFILEKVLFQKYDDYDYIEQLLDKKKSLAWVNCPRRYYPNFITIKEIIKNEDFECYISGSDWGLGCNFIHFLDVISFIGGYENYQIDISCLDKDILNSKRAGYKEITGTITGSIGHCKRFVINSSKEVGVDSTIMFKSKNCNIFINQTTNEMYYIGEKTKWLMKKEKYEVLYQSQLSNIYIEELLNTGKCNLTEYKESSILHKLFISELSEFFYKHGEAIKICPIT